MGNEGKQKRQTATKSGPQPGNFPLGSEKSRAAARAALEARAATSDEKQLLLVVMKAGQRLALESDVCIEILRECGRLPKGPCGVVDLGKIPDGLNAADTERFLREHGRDCATLR
jgi:hypothetical protein